MANFSWTLNWMIRWRQGNIPDLKKKKKKESQDGQDGTPHTHFSLGWQRV